MKKINYKLLLLFFVISIIPILIIGTAYYFVSRNTLLEKTNLEMRMTIEQAGKNIEQELSSMRKIIQLITSDSNVLILLSQLDFSKLDGTFYITDRKLTEELFPYVNDASNLALLSIFPSTGGRYYYSNPVFMPEEQSIRRESWFEQAQQLNGTIHWIGPEEHLTMNGTAVQLYSAAVLLKNLRLSFDTGTVDPDKTAVLYLAFDEDMFADILAPLQNTLESSRVMLVDSRLTVISHTDPELFNQSISDEPVWSEAFPDESGVFEDKIRSERTLISYCHIPVFDYYLIRTVPYSIVTAQLNYIIRLTLLICLACLVLIFILAYLTSNRIAAPLMKLNEAMKRVESGDFRVAVQVTSRDEIGQIQGRFNTMVHFIRQYFDEAIRIEKDKQIEELKALQYQVNPHFLYNNLSTIRLMSMLAGSQNITLMLDALIRLLKNTIGKFGDKVPVSLEIQNIKDFVYIQQVRYNGNIAMSYDIDPEIESYYLPNFILQPLVENSIFHGLEPKKGVGEIRITGKVVAGQLSFTVADNGVGMSQEQVSAIMAQPQASRPFAQIGIRNVADRIRLNFGPAYGITIKSEPECGTEITATFPIITGKER